MTFAVGFMRVSESLLAFVHTDENAIFLYRLLEEQGRLELARVLGLPPLCDGGRLNFAQCFSEQNPIFAHKYRHPNGRAPPRFPFRYNPADGVAFFVLGVGLEDIPGASMTIASVVHRRALVALADAASSDDATAPGGTSGQRVTVPWDSWGPSTTRCLEVPYWRRCSGPVGQRWGILTHDELVLRNFNPHSVRQTAAQLAADCAVSTTDAQHENGDRTRVVTTPTLLTAGLCFRGDVMTHLPYVETRAVCTSRWESVLTDGERLFAIYFKVRPITITNPRYTHPSLPGGRCRPPQSRCRCLRDVSGDILASSVTGSSLFPSNLYHLHRGVSAPSDKG
jgi:hypothetical protein